MADDTQEQLVALLLQTNVATLFTILNRHGLQRCFLHGVKPLHGKKYRFAAPAFTMRAIAAREDKTQADHKREKQDPRTNVQRQAVEQCPPGHALVIDCRGNPRGAAGGNILYERMQRRGVAAVVTDGGCRDGFEIAELGLPVYVQDVSPPLSYMAHRFIELQTPVTVAEVAVYPGDYMVGDPDGVIVVPQEIAGDVAREALAYEKMEEYIVARIREDAQIFGTYPLHGEELQRYEKYRDAREAKQS